MESPFAHGGLDGSSQPAWMRAWLGIGQGAVSAFPLAPADAPCK
ncbi:unnamed protein product [Ectocarpus sp. CCAP 1310/34]|nr:unnamed protein product [Ectocarpus sp. CCAP 1310/34]